MPLLGLRKWKARKRPMYNRNKRPQANAGSAVLEKLLEGFDRRLAAIFGSRRPGCFTRRLGAALGLVGCRCIGVPGNFRKSRRVGRRTAETRNRFGIAQIDPRGVVRSCGRLFTEPGGD